MSDLLSPEHRKMLEVDSGISSEVISDRGYRTTTRRAELRQLGFSDKQLSVPALLIPICSVSGEIVLYQVRPDLPSTREGKLVKYDTPAGARVALDVHPSARHLLGSPKIDLWVTEGVKKGDALVSQGCCAIALLGVWNWRGTNDDGGKTVLADWEYVMLKGRKVYIVFDSDVMSKPEVYAALRRLKAFLERRGAKIAVVYLPHGKDGKKVGVDDYLASGHSIEDLESLAVNELRRPIGDSGAADGAATYEQRDSGLFWLKSTRSGPIPIQLTNFRAKIVSDVEEDDGLEIHRTFELEASLSGRSKRFRVLASQFSSMSWVHEELGAQAVLHAGFGLRDHARVGIQVLSGGVPRRVLYRHTGWRELDGTWVFLHAGGATGPNGTVEAIEVSLPEVLDNFILPDPPKGQRLTEAVKASLSFIDVAPDTVTIPILAYLYRTPVGDVDHGIHLEGTTGVGKTEIAGIAQSHWGVNLNSRNLPGSWSSTANALEELCFIAKDTTVVIDDLAPTGTSADVQRLHREADRIFRSLGNRSARRRLRSDASLKAPRPPRCGVISTGEDVPKGQSLRARLSVVPIGEGDVDWALLSRLQQQAEEGYFAQAMAGYIQQLAPRYATLPSEFKALVAEKRNRTREVKTHRRTSDIAAQLIVSISYFLDFAEEVGAISPEAKEELKHRADVALNEMSDSQADHQSDNDPTQRFISLISSALSSGRVHMATRNGGVPDHPAIWGWTRSASNVAQAIVGPWSPQGQLIGWVEGDDCYLDPQSAFAEAQRFAKLQDDPMALSLASLGRRLDEQGLLASTECRGKKKSLKVRQTLQGHRRYVFHIKVDSLHAQKVAQVAQSGVDTSTDPSTAGQLSQHAMVPPDQVAQPSSPSSSDIESIGQLGQPEKQGEDPNDDPWDDFMR